MAGMTLLGHNAKYGSYTIMNAETSEIIDFFIRDVLNAGNSNRLELYDSLKAFKYLLEPGFEISSITNRHNSIRKYLKENCSMIIHQLDIWHFSNKLVGWIKPIINHFWWSSATSQENPVKITREKWLSVLQHVSNKHDCEGNQFYHSCEHGLLSSEEERTKDGYQKVPMSAMH